MLSLEGPDGDNAASELHKKEHTTGTPCPTCASPVAEGMQFCGSCGGAIMPPDMPTNVLPNDAAAALVSQSMRTDTGTGTGTGTGGVAKPSIGKKTLFFGAMQAARAKLVLIKGDGLDGVSFTLAGEEHVAGRENAALLFDEDPFLSPTHANFFYRSGELVVRDESDANGIFIRIRGSREVGSGDRFLVGEQVIQIQEQTIPSSPVAEADGTYFYASPNPSGPHRLVQILRGGGTGLAFSPLADVVSLGREENDINFPDDPFISGHHAQISFGSGGVTLTDLGSKNGTFLRVNNESPLEHGDYVFMGQQLLRVEIV